MSVATRVWSPPEGCHSPRVLQVCTQTKFGDEDEVFSLKKCGQTSGICDLQGKLVAFLMDGIWPNLFLWVVNAYLQLLIKKLGSGSIWKERLELIVSIS